jgi:hypothetical protein
MARSPYWEMSKEELVEKLMGVTPDSIAAAHMQAILQIRTIEEAFKNLTDSQNNNARASDQLAAGVFWLTLVIALSTVVLAIVETLTLIFK